MRRKKKDPDREAKLQALIEEAIVDCYNEEEEFSGMLCTLEDRLDFPFQAKVMGEIVEVVGLDDEMSSLRRGIFAKVKVKGNKTYTIALSEIELLEEHQDRQDWLDAYAIWSSR